MTRWTREEEHRLDFGEMTEGEFAASLAFILTCLLMLWAFLVIAPQPERSADATRVEVAR